MQEASVVTDQQLRAAYRAVIGKSEFAMVRENKKDWDVFHAHLPKTHKPTLHEQRARCAEAEGLIYQVLQPWGFCLYKKGSQRPDIRPMAYTPEKGLHYVDAPVSISVSSPKGAAAQPDQASIKNDVPQVGPVENRILKTPKQIAADAARLIESERAAGRALSCSDAVKQIISNPEILITAETGKPGPRLPGGHVSWLRDQARELARQVSDLVASEAMHGRKLTNVEALAIITRTEGGGNAKQLAHQARQHIDWQAALGNRVTVAKAVSTISQQNQGGV